MSSSFIHYEYYIQPDQVSELSDEFTVRPNFPASAGVAAHFDHRVDKSFIEPVLWWGKSGHQFVAPSVRENGVVGWEQGFTLKKHLVVDVVEFDRCGVQSASCILELVVQFADAPEAVSEF